MFKFYFQLSYMVTFMFTLIGIAGNFELGVETPMSSIVLAFITGFLTITKFIYVSLQEN